MSDLKSLEGCVGSYNILWAVTYEHDVYHRTEPDAFGDTEPAGHTTEMGVEHIVAYNETLARAAFDWRHPNYKFLNMTKLLVVDLIVRV